VAVNSNLGHFYVLGDSSGMTYDGTLGTGEIFHVARDTGVCSQWDGATGFPGGVSVQVPGLVDASGDPVALGGVPADGQPMTHVILGIVAIKTTCDQDDMQAGTPFIGGGTGDAQEPTVSENSVEKMVARLTDLQALNAADGDDFHWYFYTGYILNTNNVV
jgi:hypothetical protein